MRLKRAVFEGVQVRNLVYGQREGLFTGILYISASVVDVHVLSLSLLLIWIRMPWCKIERKGNQCLPCNASVPDSLTCTSNIQVQMVQVALVRKSCAGMSYHKCPHLGFRPPRM